MKMSISARNEDERADFNDKKRKYDSSSSDDGDRYLLFNNDQGYCDICSKIRSILYHPIGMMLTTLLNDVPPPVMPDEFWCGFDKEKLLLYHDGDISDRDQIFAAAVLK